MTQRQLARETGIHWSNINHVLTNRRTPGLANALKLERVTGIPVEAWKPTEVAKPRKRKVAKVRNAQYIQADNSHAR